MSNCLSCKYCVQEFNGEASPTADGQMEGYGDYYIDCKFDYHNKFTIKTDMDCKRFRRN